jgi:hypothetical protein
LRENKQRLELAESLLQELRAYLARIGGLSGASSG